MHQHSPKLPKRAKAPPHHQGSLLKRAISRLSEITPEKLGWTSFCSLQREWARLSESPLKPMKNRLNRGLETQP